MATRLSPLEIEEIKWLLEQGKALPEKYREILFTDQLPVKDSTSEERTIEPPLAQANEEASSTAFSLTSFGKFILDDPRVQQTVGKYIDMVVSKMTDELKHIEAKCTDEIIEMVPQILLQSGNDEYLVRWQNETLIQDSRRQLRRVIHERLIQRRSELTKEGEAKEREQRVKELTEEREEIQRLLAKYADLVNTFLAIAERKVSVLDEYGDERMHLLGKEVHDCVAKIAGREGLNEMYIKRELKQRGIWSHKVPKQFREIGKMLPVIFAKYHEEQKGKKKTIEEMASLSGVDFETAVGRILLEHGWQVTATPPTGDQGADIIASKEERRVIIQAKRYSGAVGNKAVQEVVGAILFYGGTEGCVVTNSTFTPAARALAQKNNIRLIDGPRFQEIAEL
jgi:HJR/Mrr/RecB family endonuclease